MACFLVPTTEAIVTTIAKKAVEAKEQSQQTEDSKAVAEESVKIPFSTKLGWLNKMLWGGSALLAFEHVWHGEVAPYFPFLTAAETAEGARTMLHEMATTGSLMAVLVTVTWIGMVAISNRFEKESAPAEPAKQKVEK